MREDLTLKKLKGKDIILVQVVWNEANGDSTWELEDMMNEQFPQQLFSSSLGERRLSLSEL
ncbi:hypothetical protein CR513_57129, partial [Mucuna pruriens]